MTMSLIDPEYMAKLTEAEKLFYLTSICNDIYTQYKASPTRLDEPHPFNPERILDTSFKLIDELADLFLYGIVGGEDTKKTVAQAECATKMACKIAYFYIETRNKKGKRTADKKVVKAMDSVKELLEELRKES